MDVEYHTGDNHNRAVEVRTADLGYGAEEEDETENLAQERAARNHQHRHGGTNRRRGSMSHNEEKQRRASIKAILADDSITPHERRRSIQHLMDGRRSSIGTASVASSSAGSSELVVTHLGASLNSHYGGGDNPYDYGYGEAAPTPRHGHNNDFAGEYDGGHHHPRHHEIYANTPGSYVDGMGHYCIPICNENTKRAEMTRPPCSHYERKCTTIAPCCGAAFGCRICHDDSPILPPLLIAKQATQSRRRHPRSSSLPGGFTNMGAPQTPEDTHTIDRFAVKEVICRECYTKQSSKT